MTSLFLFPSGCSATSLVLTSINLWHQEIRMWLRVDHMTWPPCLTSCRLLSSLWQLLQFSTCFCHNAPSSALFSFSSTPSVRIEESCLEPWWYCLLHLICSPVSSTQFLHPSHDLFIRFLASYSCHAYYPFLFCDFSSLWFTYVTYLSVFSTHEKHKYHAGRNFCLITWYISKTLVWHTEETLKIWAEWTNDNYASKSVPPARRQKQASWCPVIACEFICDASVCWPGFKKMVGPGFQANWDICSQNSATTLAGNQRSFLWGLWETEPRVRSYNQILWKNSKHRGL